MTPPTHNADGYRETFRGLERKLPDGRTFQVRGVNDYEAAKLLLAVLDDVPGTGERDG